MNRLLPSLRLGCATLMLAACSLAAAAPVPFFATFAGQSDIVGVVDPDGPVVQVQTAASGNGVFGLLHYFSGDQVNLATGAGQGSSRFVADDGSELFGVFTVQLLPSGDPALLELVGLVDFVGGSGRFAGAAGSAGFTGAGQFTSPTTALTSFDFRGEISLVDNPATLALALAGLAAGAAIGGARRRGYMRQPRPGSASAFTATPVTTL